MADSPGNLFVNDRWTDYNFVSMNKARVLQPYIHF